MSLEEAIASIPTSTTSVQIDAAGVQEALRIQNVSPDSILAATYCSFGQRNIEALIDDTVLAVVHPSGIVASAGKRKLLGGQVKFNSIEFSQCRSYGPDEFTDERGLGKYCIEFVGAGNILIGRLQWAWRAKRFRDSRQEIMAVAEERDRILEVVSQIL